MGSRRDQPLAYACSGCSDAAQLANHLALRLDREGLAEMSCIAGVGGDVPALVRLAISGRPIVALDGCPLHCAAACLARHGVAPTRHVVLSDLGVTKRLGRDFDAERAGRLLRSIRPKVAALWSKATTEAYTGACDDAAPDAPGCS